MLLMELWSQLQYENVKVNVWAPFWIAGRFVHRLWWAVQNCDAYLCMFVVFFLDIYEDISA